jgi:hypothetical protein
MFHRSPTPPSVASASAAVALAQIAGAAVTEQGVVESMTRVCMTTERQEGKPWSGLPFGIEEVAL